MERITIDGKEYGKIPFDFERWQSGDFVKVVTRNNKDAKQLTIFDCPDKFPARCTVGEDIISYTPKGYYLEGSERHILDLHLIIELPQPKEYWQNVYKYTDSQTINHVQSDFKIQSDADKYVDNRLVRIGYFKTTISEGQEPKYEFIPINQ